MHATKRSISAFHHAWFYCQHRAFSVSPSNTKLGFIGTGVMGRHMCSHLINAGYSMTVFNRTLSKCEPLKSIGASIAHSPHEVAQQSDIIFTMVGYPHDVESTILDPQQGVLSGCSSEKEHIIVDMTTSEPSLAQTIADQCLSSKHVSCLDAPVSGGDVGAKNATLAIMVGGERSTYDRVLPLFEIMGNNIKYLGGSGSGQHTKMVNQILISSNMVGVCEGLLYAYRVGLNLEETIQAIGTGAAGSFSLNVLGPRIVSGDLDPGFFVEHFIKDMGIALDEAKKMNISLPGLALTHQMYVALKSKGHGKKGTQALILALESLSGYDGFATMEQNRQKEKENM
eukprot:60758_1